MVYLQDVLDALDCTNNVTSWFVNRETGAVLPLVDSDAAGSWEDESEVDFEPGEWCALPDSFVIDDWANMRDFAYTCSDEVFDQVQDAIHRRGAFGNFRRVVDRFGLTKDWYAFRDARHRELAVEWLDAAGISWVEGSRPHRDSHDRG